MSTRTRRPLAIVLTATLVVLACTLPQRLLGSPVSEGPDLLQEPAETAGAAAGESGGAEDQPGIADYLSGMPTSPAYDIYVGANVKGNCGPYTNSGGFAWLTFDTVIRGVRFSAPSDAALPGPTGGISQTGGLPMIGPGMGLLGEGTLGDFTFCPMYEPEAHTCTVTDGPLPFEPSLSLGTSDMGIPVIPLVGTPGPTGGGEAVLIYSIGAAAGLQPMLRWDCEIGLGALGGAVEPVQVAFSTSWDRLMLGEEFEMAAISSDEGGTWTWSMRFVPVE